MRALVFEPSIPKYLLARAFGARNRELHVGPRSCFALRTDVASPATPSRDFALLAPRLAGFCGSDLSAVMLKSCPSIEVFGSYPAVFGHEILADVVSPPVGSDLREGDRVVVDPWLSCEVRNAPACARCAVGEYATCERASSGPFKGIMIGACEELPGGFGERMLAHRSQLFRVSDGVADTRAVLSEPLSVAVHAVSRNPPRGAERVLVIGGGIIAFATIWALREMYPEAHVSSLALEPYQLEIARSLGAERTIRPGEGIDVVASLGIETGATVLRPRLGRPFLAGGYDRVYDCIGTQRSIDDALRVARAGGTVVLVGAAGVVPKLDWSFVWIKELHVAGTLAYGFENHRAERRRTFDITMELLGTSATPIERLVTHTFPLERYAEAIDTNLDRRGTKSVKTVFAPQARS